MVDLIALIGFIIILAIVLLAAVIKTFINNSRICFINNTINVNPSTATVNIPITVSGILKSSFLLPDTSLMLTITRSDGNNISIFDANFPSTMYGGYCVPFELVFVPAKLPNDFFDASGTYLLNVILLCNNLDFASITSSIIIIVELEKK